MRFHLLFFFSVLIYAFNAKPVFAQSQDSLVQVLVKKHIAINKSKQTLPGYRVQLFFGGDRNKAYEVRSDFIKVFSTTPSYIVYHQPNFKVRVGDFRTKLEAMNFLKEVQPLFEAAFIVKDEVKLPELYLR